MGNIVGEGFKTEILEQVNQRQSQYGSINRDNQTLNYLNNTTGWVKVVSSVDLTEEVAKLRGIDLSGSELAKAYVLSGGVSPLKSGIARDGSITNSNVYGLGGNEFGLRPMPGVTKASIKTETDGALKSATVNLKANNRTQFDIIDLLYMRLGYSILLEWGHTSYFTNEGDYVSDNLETLETEFLNGTVSYEGINEEINKKRETTNGNYDAVFAKVVNFSWSFQPDGTYDITLTLRSMGDVVGSLKTNILLDDNISLNDESKDKEKEEEIDDTDATKVIVHYRNTHSIGRFFYDSLMNTPFDQRQKGEGQIRYFSTDNIKTQGKSINFIRQNFRGNGPDEEYYIRFGHFLEWIEDTLIPRVKDAPLINIDTDVDSNIVHLQRYQLSVDPGVCVFKSKWKIRGGDSYEFIPGGETFVFSKNGNRYGKIMNSYISMRYIINLLNDLPSTPEDSGNKGLYDLIDEICKGWNKSTGHFNSLSPSADSETNTLRIIDSTALPDKDSFLEELDVSTKAPIFEIYGYATRDNVSKSSFITKFDFTTTISNDLATMVTVGATSRGNMVGEDASSLSRMNSGLTDRIKTDISYSPTKEEIEKNRQAAEDEFTQAAIKKTKLEENYKESLKDFTEFIKTLGIRKGRDFRGKWDIDVIESYTNVVIDLLKYDQEKLTEQEKRKNPEKQPASPNSGFLPFNLSLGMKGLSGIKVYQKFEVDTDYLPSNYPTSLEFLIKTITHDISNNQWSTTIDSMAIPKNPFGSGAQRELPEKTPSGGSDSDGNNSNDEGGTPAGWTDTTVTSGFALNPKGHDGSRNYPKTQILFHYSAGWQSNDDGQSVLRTLNSRGLSYHYIITATGHIEQVVDDSVRAYHAGMQNPKLSGNSKSIGVNLQNIGYARKTSSTEEGITQNLEKNNQLTGNVKLVDYEGKPSPYRGHDMAQEITDAQLNALNKLVTQLKANNKGIPSYKWEGKTTFDQLFPPSGTSYLTSKAGLFTHNSNNTGKSDILPTPKIVQFFKDLVL